ncbi:MAG: LytTR family DNA-binding domain-containing protein [Bacteroidia bacterium]|jgi:two-component system LytT family response regulator|nr:LytTR family DNA-binding domain-containing protein [Bacteroidia bacterium]
MHKRLHAVLVDDEPLQINVLGNLLQTHCPDIHVIATFSSPHEALEAIPDLEFDLLFLDVEMPVMTGFELLEKIGAHSFRVIFITSHEIYAAKAFRVNALDYLLKPIKVDELKTAVKKFGKEVLRESLPPRASSPLQFVEKQLMRRLPIAASDGIHIVDIDNILYLEASSNYTTFYLRQGKNIVASRNLAFFESQLPEIKFFRTHKSFLIHLRYIHRYIRGEGGFVEMTDGRQIEVSRRRKADLLRVLEVS